MWPKLLHAENLEEEPLNPSLICSPPKMSNNQEHLRYGTFFWDVGAEVVLIRLHLFFFETAGGAPYPTDQLNLASKYASTHQEYVKISKRSCQLGAARYHLSGRKLLAEDETEKQKHQRHRCSIGGNSCGELAWKFAIQTELLQASGGRIAWRLDLGFSEFQCFLNSKSLSNSSYGT